MGKRLEIYFKMTEKRKEGLLYYVFPFYRYAPFCLYVLLKYYWIM